MFDHDVGVSAACTRTSGRTGSSWSAPRRRRLLAGAAALTVGLGALAAPSATPDEPVGTLATSMVEMLGRGDTTNVMTLAALREHMAGNSDVTNAGAGIDVAVIDTGVAPVAGLDGPGKLLHGPDLSFEGAAAEVAYLDTYGHGTHMAGIIAGTRPDAPGIAPGARLVSLKVAGHDGLTTVPQVVAAIDWVIEHRNTHGLNIRVLNLSLGQAGVTNHVGDELSMAVERAWNAGIVVVVAAGNRGISQRHLDSPAVAPLVVAVGASEIRSTRRNKLEYVVPEWSAYGDRVRDPEVVAPGASIASYRVPGSTVDVLAPTARYEDDFFLGSGTSQAAAVTSGLAAALLQYHPYLQPDDVKAALEHWAREIDDTSTERDGEGFAMGVDTVLKGAPSGDNTQKFPSAFNGRVSEPDEPTWTGGEWTGASWSGASWSGTVWSGASWSGASWSGASWSGASWSGASWSGASWSGASWSGASWSGASWSGASWSGTGWS